MKLENVSIDLDPNNKKITIYIPQHSAADQQLAHESRMLAGAFEREGYELSFMQMPVVRTPNASKGLVACSCGECDTVRCESTKKACIIRESQIPTVWPINARAIRPDQRFISAVDGIPNADYVDIVVSGDTAMDNARYTARALRRNELYTAGTNAEFTGDATLSSACGYCENHELSLNGRSLTDIVAFLQDENSACTEPFEVSIQVRAKPRKDT